MKLSSRDVQDAKNPAAVIITPPLGLHRIERFRMSGMQDKAKAFAPDAKRLMRCVKKSLEERGVPSYLVSHEEIVKNRGKYAKESLRALQLLVEKVYAEPVGRSKVYKVSCSLGLIDTQSGSTIYSDSIIGICNDSKVGATTAFYNCIRDIVVRFVSCPKFAAGIKK